MNNMDSDNIENSTDKPLSPTKLRRLQARGLSKRQAQRIGYRASLGRWQMQEGRRLRQLNLQRVWQMYKNVVDRSDARRYLREFMQDRTRWA